MSAATETAKLMLKEKGMRTNPFTDEYWKAELSAYGLRRAKFHVEHVSVDWFQIQGRCDDYLNVNMRFEKTPLPRLGINGHLWMSLTPMEIQSAALALHRAEGVVASGGLGLGYFAIRAAAKPEVTKVIVFENEPLVIEWFRRMFKDRLELTKIEIVEGDIRKTFKGYTVDFCFMDIYPDMLGDHSAFADSKKFRKQNKIGRYMFWGYEKVVLGLMVNRMIKYGSLLLGHDLVDYLKHWKATPYTPGNPDDGTLADYYRSQDGPQLEILVAGKRVMYDFPM